MVRLVPLLDTYAEWHTEYKNAFMVTGCPTAVLHLHAMVLIAHLRDSTLDSDMIHEARKVLQYLTQT